jgi:Formin Homology 2 Domain
VTAASTGASAAAASAAIIIITTTTAAAAAAAAGDDSCAVQDHIAACEQLQRSPAMRTLLSATLAAGNFLNHGSRLGNAPGFRLKGLNKLHDARSTDGKATLLQV